jgi:periplasmic protein TonB
LLELLKITILIHLKSWKSLINSLNSRWYGSIWKFLQKNFKYPEAAQSANVSGKIYVEFIVEIDGSLSNINVIKSVGMGVDEETIRFLNLSPKWTPAKYKGRNVRSRFSMPLNICLSE